MKECLPILEEFTKQYVTNYIYCISVRKKVSYQEPSISTYAFVDTDLYREYIDRIKSIKFQNELQNLISRELHLNETDIDVYIKTIQDFEIDKYKLSVVHLMPSCSELCGILSKKLQNSIDEHNKKKHWDNVKRSAANMQSVIKFKTEHIKTLSEDTIGLYINEYMQNYSSAKLLTQPLNVIELKRVKDWINRKGVN